MINRIILVAAYLLDLDMSDLFGPVDDEQVRALWYGSAAIVAQTGFLLEKSGHVATHGVLATLRRSGA